MERVLTRMLLWVLWGERNGRIFIGVDRDLSEIRSFVCFHVSLWASVSKSFCNYSIGVILHSWRPSYRGVTFLCGLGFLVARAFFHSF